MDPNNIFPRRQTGKLMIRWIMQEQIEREVAFNVWNGSGMLNYKEREEDLVENINESNFVVNFDYGKTFGFVGSKGIKYE